MRIARVATLVWLAGCAATAGSARSQTADSTAQRAPSVRRTYTTQHLNGAALRLDGRLDDACWGTVEWSTDFMQWEPTEGKPPTYQTAFKILYDEHALYIAYRAYDAEPRRSPSILSRRDGFPGDWVEINIDSYHDQRTAFSFTSSVSGVRGDEFVSERRRQLGRQLGSDLGAGDADRRARAGPPRSAFRSASCASPIATSRSGAFRCNGVCSARKSARSGSRSRKNEPGWVSRFGELRGIRGIQPQRQVELLPYTVGRGERFEPVAGDPFLDGSDAGLRRSAWTASSA